MTITAEIRASLDTQLGELEAVADAPTGDLVYGVDLSCVSDCRDDFAEVSYGTAQIIAEAVARRFITPRGTLLDDADYGFDLRAYLSVAMTQIELRNLHTRAVAEALKDERVDTITIELTVETKLVTMNATLTPRDPALAPFPFVLSVTSAAAVLDLLNAR